MLSPCLCISTCINGNQMSTLLTLPVCHPKSVFHKGLRVGHLRENMATAYWNSSFFLCVLVIYWYFAHLGLVYSPSTSILIDLLGSGKG